MKIPQIGIIGCGSMGQSLVRAGTEAQIIRLHAAADPDNSSRQQFSQSYPQANLYGDAAEMLAAGGLDGVLVATPPFLRRQYVDAILDAGLPVFVEKPLALSVEDAVAMQEAARQRGLPLMVGHVLRLLQPFRTIIQEVRSGTLGAPLAVTITRTCNGYGSFERSWRNQKELAGNGLFEVSVHEFDFICEIFNAEPLRVSALGTEVDTPRTNNDYRNSYSVHLDFGHGRIGHSWSSLEDALGTGTGHVILERGALRYDSWDGSLQRSQLHGEKTCIASEKLEKTNAIEEEIAMFSEAIGSGIAPALGAEDGVRAVKIAIAAGQSADAGGVPVTLT